MLPYSIARACLCKPGLTNRTCSGQAQSALDGSRVRVWVAPSQHLEKYMLIRFSELELLESTLMENFEESCQGQLPRYWHFTILISGVGVAKLTMNPLFGGVMQESESQICGIVSTLNYMYTVLIACISPCTYDGLQGKVLSWWVVK